MKNVLAIITMCKKCMRSVSPAQGVLFSIWMLLSFPKLFKSKVIDKCGFVLMMESSYLNLGVTSEILNRLIRVMLAVTTNNVLYTFAFLRNSIQQLIAFRMNLEQKYYKLIC